MRLMTIINQPVFGVKIIIGKIVVFQEAGGEGETYVVRLVEG
ncbi:MAG: hypothetical protein K0R75_3048 [Paenibacillaceae bacterium]|nr:hypothetical protein [Paenibacillaceae bacterium]